MAPSTIGSQTVTKEWIDGNTNERLQASEPSGDLVNLNFIEELYQTVLKVFTERWRLVSSSMSLARKRIFKEALGRLYLWGRDFQNGGLASISAQSDDLRDTILDLLASIGKCFLKLFPKATDDSLTGRTQDLQALITRSRLITDPSDHWSSDFEEELEGDEAPPTTLLPLKAGPRNSIGAKAIEDGEKSDDESEVDELLACHVDCLLDLLPTMEQTLAHLKSVQNHAETLSGASISFAVSSLALPWVKYVSDRFTKAETTLVERLGESNWQRFATVRARMEQVAINSDSSSTVDEKILRDTFKDEGVAVFKPHSLFHDSGLGSSMPTRYAVSIASHTSFVSSIGADQTSALRVPITPKEVDTGDPFNCDLCGHLLFKIKNRVDWKIHVFADLQPYICTFESCLVTFPTRKLWANHEFSEHRVTRIWTCPECTEIFQSLRGLEKHLRDRHEEIATLAQFPLILAAAESSQSWPIATQECPLCKDTAFHSRRTFVTHVGRHMETIALAVLPRETEEESEEDEIGVVDDTSDRGYIDSDTTGYFFVPSSFRFETRLTGRDQELGLIDKSLFDDRRRDSTASVAIHGQNLDDGVQVVQHYINENRAKFPGGVFWIDTASIRSSVYEIADNYIQCHNPGDQSTDKLVGIVEAWFESRSDWLIVIEENSLRWKATGQELVWRGNFPCPIRSKSSLIYIVSSPNLQHLATPLNPIPLEILPKSDRE